MKIAVAGASGRAGSCITAELARRGHDVTGIARNPDKIAKLANVTAVAGDANDPFTEAVTEFLLPLRAAVGARHVGATRSREVSGS